jgi:hypothetical protein
LEFVGSVGTWLQRPVSGGGEEVCDGPCFVEEALNLEAAFVWTEVAGGFLGLGAGGEGEGDASLEFNEADSIGEDGGWGDDSGFCGAGEHEFHEGPVFDTFAELGDEFLRAFHGG